MNHFAKVMLFYELHKISPLFLRIFILFVLTFLNLLE